MSGGTKAFLVLGILFVALAVAGLVLILLDLLPRWVAIGGMLLLVLGAVLVGSALTIQARDRREERIRRRGIEGTAKVIQWGIAGKSGAVSMDAVESCGYEVEITVEGRDPYRVRGHQLLPFAVYSQISEGMVLPVKVDPKDPQRILLA